MSLHHDSSSRNSGRPARIREDRQRARRNRLTRQTLSVLEVLESRTLLNADPGIIYVNNDWSSLSFLDQVDPGDAAGEGTEATATYGVNAFSSIQAAVNNFDPTPDHYIKVIANTSAGESYAESVSIFRDVTLVGVYPSGGSLATLPAGDSITTSQFTLTSGANLLTYAPDGVSTSGVESSAIVINRQGSTASKGTLLNDAVTLLAPGGTLAVYGPSATIPLQGQYTNAGDANVVIDKNVKLVGLGTASTTNQVTLTSGAQLLTGSNPFPNTAFSASIVNIDRVGSTPGFGGTRIADAVNLVQSGGTINASGTFTEDVNLNKMNVTIQPGSSAATLVANTDAGQKVTASGVSVKDLTLQPHSGSGTTLTVSGAGAKILNNTFDTAGAAQLVMAAGGAGATITGNVFSANQTGVNPYFNDLTGLYSIPTILANTFVRSVTVQHVDSSYVPAIWANINPVVALATTLPGDTVHVGAGAYNEQVVINKTGLKVTGAGEGSTTIHFAGADTTGGRNGVVAIIADDAELSSLTVSGAGNTSAGVRYGVKIAPYPSTGPGIVINGVKIDDVEISGNFRNGLDANQAANLTVDDLNSHDNGGAGIFLTDVKVATLSNITTLNNPWAGVSIATSGASGTLGTNGIVFSGTNSFGESGTANGGLQLEMFDSANPANPAAAAAITWSSNASDGADVTIQAADFQYALGANASNGFDGPEHYVRFYDTLEHAKTAAFATGDGVRPDHFVDNNGSRYIQNADSASAAPDFEVYANPNMSIQAAITASVPTDVVNVAAGQYNENLTIDHGITLQGAAGGGTIISPLLGFVDATHTNPVIMLTGSGTAADPLTIKNLQITTSKALKSNGIEIPGGAQVSYLTLDHVSVTGDVNPGDLFLSEQPAGFWIYGSAGLDHLTVADSEFDNLVFGWVFNHDLTSTKTVQYVDVTNTTFNNNLVKGLYTEMLSDATFTDVTASNNGLIPPGGYQAGSGAGIDINLKAGTYQDLTFNNLNVTGNGTYGDPTNPTGPVDAVANGVGLTIRARGTGTDSSYSAHPATLTGVTINGGSFTDDRVGIRIGEPGKALTGTTGVVLQNSTEVDGLGNPLHPLVITGNLDSGVELAGGSTSITGGTITGNQIGIRVDTATARIQGADLSGNDVGLWVQNNGHVDAGGGSLGSTGGNTFTGYIGTGSPSVLTSSPAGPISLTGINYAIVDLNPAGNDVYAQQNDFGAYAVSSILETVLYDHDDAPSLSQIIVSPTVPPAGGLQGTVYVDHAWAGKALGSTFDPDAGGPLTNLTFGLNAFATIQQGVDAVQVGGTVDVVNYNAAGTAGSPYTYTENVSITKALSLIGQGSDAATGTVISIASGAGVTIASGGVTLQGLYIQGNGSTDGVYIDSAVSGVTLTNVVSTGHDAALEIHDGAVVTNLTLNQVGLINSTVGLRVATTGKVNGLTVAGSQFDGNEFGWYIAADSGSTTNQTGFTGINVTGSSFSNDTRKGIYAEKLNNAVFKAITVDSSGTSGAYADTNGININLKYGSYAGITITNDASLVHSVITNSGTGTNARAALAIDADGSYGASLSGVTLTNLTINSDALPAKQAIDLSIGDHVSDVTMSGVELNGAGLGLLYFGTDGGLDVGDTAFAGTLAGYIVNGSTSGVDATNHATFNGFDTGAGSPTADLSTYFAVEDKIGDAIDAVGPGLVLLKANHVFVSQTNLNLGTAPFTTSTPSIQRGIDAVPDASTGWTVHVEAGTYNENVVIDESVTVLGQGADPEGTILQIASGNGVTIAADGVTLQGFFIVGNASTDGVYIDSTVNNDTLRGVISTGHNAGLEIHNAAVVGNLTLDQVGLNNNTDGLRVATQGKVHGLTVTGSSFGANEYGWNVYADSASTTNQNDFTDINVTNSFFNSNTFKGLYAEKLDDATFDGITVTGSGTGATSPNGINLNLKYGTYSGGITITGASKITDSGTGTATGAGLAIDGRNDGAYSGNPASISNVNLTGLTIIGSPIDLSIGDNVTGVSMSGVKLNGAGVGLSYFGTAGGLDVGDTAFAGTLANYIINSSTSGVDATNHATFGGFDAGAGDPTAAADLASFFAVEGKIGDVIDAAGVGLVRLNAGQVFVTATVQGAGSPSIQRGINAADPDETVWVQKGVYTENVSVDNGVTLYSEDGTDIVGTLTTASGAVVSPGVGPSGTGNLATDGLTLDSGTTYHVDINGGGSDQIVSHGDVELGGATLVISSAPGYTPGAGATFTLIRNKSGDAVDGTFVGMPEGHTVTIGSVPFIISYVGGTGHDVTLTRAPTQDVWVNDTWDVAGNLVADPAFGDNVTTDSTRDLVTHIDASAGLTYGVNAFSTIEAAYAALTGTGGTIHVIEGSYGLTSTITLGAGVSIVGPWAATNPLDAGRHSHDGDSSYEAIVTTASGQGAFAIAASNTNISGLTINSGGGAGIGIRESNPVAGTTIQNNIIQNFSANIGVSLSSSSNFLIDGNDIRNAGTAVYITTGAHDGMVQNNHLDGGMVLEGGDTNVLITHNQFVGASTPLYVLAFGTTGLAGTKFTNNSLAGNPAHFIVNGNADTLDASGNWWGGTTTAAGVAALAGSNVDYSPWLDSGANSETNSTAFSGDLSHLHVSAASPQVGSIGRINEAVGLLADGAVAGGARVIDVHAGTYDEAVSIGKALTLQGEAGVVINPTTGGGAAVTVTVGGVTINDLTAQGGGAGDYGIFATGADGLAVNNVAITGTGDDSSPDGLYVEDSDDVNLTGVDVTDVYGGLGQGGIVVTGGADFSGTNLTVTGTATGSGIWLNLVNGATLSGVVSSGNLVDGLTASSVTGLTVTGGTFNSNHGNGVLILDGSGLTSLTNIAANGDNVGGLGQAGLTIQDTSDVTVGGASSFSNNESGLGVLIFTFTKDVSNITLGGKLDVSGNVKGGLFLDASQKIGLDPYKISGVSVGQEPVDSTHGVTFSGNGGSGVHLLGDVRDSEIKAAFTRGTPSGVGALITGTDSGGASSPTGTQLDGSSFSGYGAGLTASATPAVTLSDDVAGFIGTEEVSALGTTFDGFAGSDVDPTKMYTVERQVDDKLDSSGLGLVRLVAGTVIATPGTGLQSAVNAATPGDTVRVAAVPTDYNYAEAVTISKDLKLEGYGGPTTTSFTLSADIDDASFGISAPTVNVNTGAHINDGILLAQDGGGTVNVTGTFAENVAVDKSLSLVGVGGATIDPASGVGIAVSGGVTASISNFTVTASGGVSISSGATAVLQGNAITGATGSGVSISGTGAKAKLVDNTITGNTVGVTVDHAIAFLQGNDLRNNTIGLKAQNGAMVDAGQFADVAKQNDFTGFGVSSGGNDFSAGYTGIATLTSGAIVDANTGDIAAADGSIVNYGATGTNDADPSKPKYDLMAVGNIFAVDAAIEHLIYDDRDDTAYGLVRYAAGTPDITNPTASIVSLGDNQTSTTFDVVINVDDPTHVGYPDETVSGVENADLYYSTDGGSSWTLAGAYSTIVGGTITVPFTGGEQTLYRFFAVARDNAGNVSSSAPTAGSTPMAGTFVPDQTPPAVTGVTVTQAAAGSRELLVPYTATDSFTNLSALTLQVSINGGAYTTVVIDNSQAAGTASLSPAFNPGGGLSASGVFTFYAPRNGASTTYQFRVTASDSKVLWNGATFVSTTPNTGVSAGSNSLTVALAPITVGPRAVIAANDATTVQQQRSFIRYVDVTLSDADIAAMIVANPSLVTITKFGIDGLAGAAYGKTYSISLVGGVGSKVLRFDFGVNGIGANGTGATTAADRNSNAGDGIYQINFNLASEGFTDSTSRFYRLLGDTNGDAQVNQTDINNIASGLNGSNYNYDTNFDGVVNTTDRFNALLQNGKKVTGVWNF